MQALDSVEAALARLMPPALSDACQQEMEDMFDELAGPETQEIPRISSGKWLVRSLMGGGIAAGIGALFAIFGGPQEPASHRELAKQPKAAAPAFVLMSESDRIESMTDEGWREDPDGGALRTLRLNAVEENSVRDEESGMEVRISEPREEILLLPINDF